MSPAAESPCPDENALARFARGDASTDEGPALEAHLDGCGSCRRAVALAAAGESSPVSVAPVLPAPGERLGHYTVESLLGRGGMGTVLLAHDETLGRKVALKLLNASGDEAARARLEREAQVMARLNHPNVVTVYELGTWSGGRFIAMEHVLGESLDAWRAGAERSTAEVLLVLRAAGQGLAAAHAAGVVHRDFKPANVLVGKDGRVRVSDFGLSRPAPEALPAAEGKSLFLTQAGALVGTPAYMAPEQLAGSAADEKSDQFSFCVTAVEALGRARPWLATTRAELSLRLQEPADLFGVPRRLKDVVRRGLALDPAHRFPSMEALLWALDAATRPPSRRPVWVGLGLAALATVGAVLLAWPRTPPLAPGEREAALSAPAPAPPADFTVAEGGLRLLFAPGLVSAELLPQAAPCAEVELAEPGELVLRGLKAGRAVLTVHAAGGARAYQVEVAPRPSPP